MKHILLGVDTGGTFTDFVCIDNDTLRVHKVLSTPTAPQKAIIQGIRELGLTDLMTNGQVRLVHGTTVATNAVLQRQGAKTVFITNQGLQDLLLLGRQTRPALYDLTPNNNSFTFDPDLMLEVSARLDAKGNEIKPFSSNELTQLQTLVEKLAPESVAISLLFSYLSATHEQQLEAIFKDQYFVSRSSVVLPEYKEYERGITTWLNAWIGPLINRYLTELSAQVSPSPLSIMQSSGLTIAAPLAANRAVNLLLSGPAGGLSAAQHIGKALNKHHLITFDMGGTSTDVSLLEGHIKLTNAGRIGGFPVSVPMADIHTIGAGGGSIAYMDAGGLLQVGPKSAGANPGPACYGQGGTEPTVTDANLVLGRLPAKALLAGGMKLDEQAAKTALTQLANKIGLPIQDVAQGIINLANEHMSQAMRVISVQRGHDPREFTLMCFGGAGGLHLCDLAESLQMGTAIIPVHAGVFSALGMLTTKPGRELVHTHQKPLAELKDFELQKIFADIAIQAKNELLEEGIHQCFIVHSLDVRYIGQTYTINIPYKGKLSAAEKAFHLAHEQQYGHQLKRPIELLNCRLHIEAVRPDINLPPREGETEKDLTAIQTHKRANTIWRRANLRKGKIYRGPAIIIEHHTTIYLKTGWQLQLDEIGNLLLHSA